MHLAEVILVVATTNCFTTFSLALAGKSTRQKRHGWHDDGIGRDDSYSVERPRPPPFFDDPFDDRPGFRDPWRHPRRRRPRPPSWDSWGSSSSENFEDWVRRRRPRPRPRPFPRRDFIRFVPVGQRFNAPVLPNPNPNTPNTQANTNANAQVQPQVQEAQTTGNTAYGSNNVQSQPPTVQFAQDQPASGNSNPNMVIHITFQQPPSNQAGAQPQAQTIFMDSNTLNSNSGSNSGSYQTYGSGSSINPQVVPSQVQVIAPTSGGGGGNYGQNYGQAQVLPNQQPIYDQAQPQAQPGSNYYQQQQPPQGYPILSNPRRYGGSGRPV